jgi:hypothetical protein
MRSVLSVLRNERGKKSKTAATQPVSGDAVEPANGKLQGSLQGQAANHTGNGQSPAADTRLSWDRLMQGQVQAQGSPSGQGLPKGQGSRSEAAGSNQSPPNTQPSPLSTQELAVRYLEPFVLEGERIELLATTQRSECVVVL